MDQNVDTATTTTPEPGGPPHVSRSKVVQRLLGLFEDPAYLEIGVSEGVTFDQVKAARKVAVDPAFLFDHEAAQARSTNAEYHAVPSDEYFGEIVDPSELFDVILIDGLHTLEQTLRDLLNALEHLQPQGVIVIDDVRPPHYHASLPDHERAVQVRALVGGTGKAWMGDVYRLVWFMETFCQHLTFRTISNNHGQAVVWRRRRAEVPQRTVRDVATLSFEDYLLNDDVLELRTFFQIYKEVRSDLGLGDSAG